MVANLTTQQPKLMWILLNSCDTRMISKFPKSNFLKKLSN